MFDGWSYAQIFRVIGQSIEERGVSNFSLAWQDHEFVVRGKRILPLEQRWVDKVLGQKAVQSERSTEIHYPYKSVVWLQIRGETLRRNPDQVPDYSRLSQTLRTVGGYIESRGMTFLSLRRSGGSLFLEFQERNGSPRVEEHGLGSFEQYFLRTYLRQRKEREARPG